MVVETRKVKSLLISNDAWLEIGDSRGASRRYHQLAFLMRPGDSVLFKEPTSILCICWELASRSSYFGIICWQSEAFV